MTTDTPKRFKQSTHAYSDRSRQSLTFSNAATAERSRSKNSALGKLACFLVLLVFLVFAGVTALSRGQHSAHFRSRGPFSNQKLRHFGQTEHPMSFRTAPPGRLRQFASGPNNTAGLTGNGQQTGNQRLVGQTTWKWLSQYATLQTVH